MEIEKLKDMLRNAAGGPVGIQMCQEAADALEQLQAENDRLRRERDAAAKDLRVCSIENFMECQYCLYRTVRGFCRSCTDGSNWKWRGRKEEG